MIYDTSGAPVKRLGVYFSLAVIASLAVTVIHTYGPPALRFVFGPTVHPLATYFLNSVSTMALFTGLVVATDRWAWKWKVFRPLFLWARSRQPPVVEGQYTGYAEYHDPELKPAGRVERWDATVRIIQRWQTINLQFDFSKPSLHAESHSTMATLYLDPDPDKVGLLHSYRHKRTAPRTDRPGIVSKTIEGTSLLGFSRKDDRWLVRGKYYSDDEGSGFIELEQEPVKPWWPGFIAWLRSLPFMTGR
jgi:hypothetical protein